MGIFPDYVMLVYWSVLFFVSEVGEVTGQKWLNPSNFVIPHRKRTCLLEKNSGWKTAFLFKMAP